MFIHLFAYCKVLKEEDALYQAACPLGLAPIEIDQVCTYALM
jgi:hypothetical protein